MTESVSEYSHDHVILLLSTHDFENLPAWLSDNFNVIEGGTHAGGSSRNKLIIFADGTCIELLNWITEPKEFFDWASKSPGLIDFALTTPQTAQETHAAVTKRLESAGGDGDGDVDGDGDGGLGIRFKQPLFGGRKRKDGQQCEWYVTKPMVDNEAPNVPKPIDRYFPTGRLDTPFFCHDVTDRNLRVPSTDTSISTHPCGAKGIMSVDVVVPEPRIKSYMKLYSSVTGADAKVHGGFRYLPNTNVSFALSSPNEKAMEGVKDRIGIELHAPRDGEDEAWLKERGVGIREIRLYVPAAGEDEVDERPLDSEGIGASLVLVVQ
ncbi:uncharacterized protein PV06_03870 [Exophiala oligosperma]|uniref:Glyoxalase-like domain-containing protein n=1 Tax=Exophiala oligosperma TaxID=215243 RepID=A0A0D2EC13_9EURO|nr:uncharacterized protein PV06_03870 [Exophiala oligosperma]KIW45479.1 hypothetical protein PV06_03870 [Exophiala oligosperma]